MLCGGGLKKRIKFGYGEKKRVREGIYKVTAETKGHLKGHMEI